MLFSDILYMLVRNVSPSGPMCLRCLMLTLSGHVELFLLCFIAARTCVVVSVIIIIVLSNHLSNIIEHNKGIQDLQCSLILQSSS